MECERRGGGGKQEREAEDAPVSTSSANWYGWRTSALVRTPHREPSWPCGTRLLPAGVPSRRTLKMRKCSSSVFLQHTTKLYRRRGEAGSRVVGVVSEQMDGERQWWGR